ncbi:hypothetical protein JFL43_20310 [Viridibacillus sp. YIM B01967]|uniref:Uncharacterized protein n=1 Tax=Viridibacillus soli TaxID=2798301 RepID=A0ABS1HCJ5_9BACL|nr:hypothetical protein [Viridibacillus soli]MBK3497132.1 hypothetical protein [Viridibacillus soli]
MGKFNLKFVKPVASLAIGAAVLTGSFAVTGATDTASAKAATVKVSKGKLVTAKTGKVVKGYKTYKSVLYKDGKKFSGVYKNTYYKTGKKATALYKGTYYKSGKKGTGLYKNVYYKNGKKGDGFYGTGSAKKWYQDGKLLTGLGKNSGKYYIKGKLANGILTYKGVEKLYKDGVVVVTVVDAAKAINNTTVEVTFASAQKASDISAGRFVIEGLEITNAAVKQSDDKVIVLTTSAQVGDKTYTVALDGVKSRTFKGVSNVQATAITNQTPSLQGVIGKQVTVKTQVDVPAGQSKAGIAVTFNITNSADTSVGNFGKRITAEVFTDANGVASYSYTQYAAGTDDTVEAYPTGNASVKATAAKVYWGNALRLTVADVTVGSKLANGSKKVYKISSLENAGGYVNVTFKENVGVNPDKLVRDVEVLDVKSNSAYPYQVTTGGVGFAKVKLDSKGEGTFTLKGTNATVTPVVFADGSYKKDYEGVEAQWSGDNKLSSTELQAEAASITFEKHSTVGVSVKAIGESRAASKTAKGDGGREYTVTVADKDGKLAPNGTKAYVTFAEGSLSKDKKVYINGSVAVEGGRHLVTVEKDGQVTFKLTGELDGYATPTVYLDNGKTVGSFDKEDEFAVSEQVYFVNAVVENAKLAPNKEKVEIGTPATFTYQSVDQNGFPYYADNGVYEVTFQVQAHFGDITVDGKSVSAGKPGSFTVKSTNGVASIKVVSSLQGTVTVNASTSQKSLPNKDASVEFVKASDLDTIVVSESIVEAVKKASNITEVKAALKGFDTYETLSDAGKTNVATTIYHSSDKSASFIGKTIASEKAKENSVDAKAAATAFVNTHATAIAYTPSVVSALKDTTDVRYVKSKAFVDAYEALSNKVVAELNTNTKTQYILLKAAVASVVANEESDKQQNEATAKVALAAINTQSVSSPDATVANYKDAGITDVVAANLTAVNTAVTTAKDFGKLTKADIQKIVSKVVVDEGLAAINAQSVSTPDATVANYKDAGIKDVTATNLTAVNTAVTTAPGFGSLTSTQIQGEVDKVVATISLAAINAGTEVYTDYAKAGVKNVTVYNFTSVKAAVAAERAVKGALTIIEIQAVVDGVK